MEEDFAGKGDTQGTATEVDEIYAWNKAMLEDHTEAEMLAEVNEVYHRYGRYPTQRGYWASGPDNRGSEHHSGEAKEARDHTLQGITPQDTKTLQ